MEVKLDTPLTLEKIKNLKAGDELILNGIIYGARDAAHIRLIKEINENKKLPFEINNSTIFYVGPSPTKPNKKSGAIGPTTSSRMDNLTEPLLKRGLRAMIGKGDRSQKIKELMKKYGAIYLVTPGGISAYLSSKVEYIKEIAYKDLGPEAIFEIKVKEFPLFVAYDLYGNDIFKLALRSE